VQKGLLDAVAAWLPEAARVCLLGDRFYGTPALIGHCQSLGWDYRLRLKGNLRLWIDGADAGPVEQLARSTPYLAGVELTARRVRTNVGLIQDPGHEAPWIVAMSEAPGYLATLDYLSEWWMSLPPTGRRSCSACSSASSTKPAWALRLTRQPTMRRANTSMTNAT